MNIQAIQRKVPWVMTPLVSLDILLTPRRWACGPDRAATGVSHAVFLPASVQADGSDQSVGKVQTVMNFQSRLQVLQTRMESEPDRYWQIYSADLEASVSA